MHIHIDPTAHSAYLAGGLIVHRYVRFGPLVAAGTVLHRAGPRILYRRQQSGLLQRLPGERSLELAAGPVRVIAYECARHAEQQECGQQEAAEDGSDRGRRFAVHL